MIKALEKWVNRSQKRAKSYGLTAELFAVVRDMKPGAALRIEGSDGKAWIIMDADDFDHVAGLGGLRPVDRTPVE